MPKKWVDWSDWKPGQGSEHPLSKPLAKGKGKDVIDEQFKKALIEGDHRKMKLQPTDEEMFGHLVVTQEQADEAEHRWQNCLNDFYTEAKKPLEKNQAPSVGRGPIHKEKRTEEEELISQIPVSGEALKDE